ncbi:MAG TPA: hypothetical protein VFD05_01410 [Bacilli bacterium]|nr:hypothetical protein [Bacilli bacterium]
MLLKDKVAGKLYIIGEYNVLKSGHSALVAPVNLYMSGTLKKDENLFVVTDNDKVVDLINDKTPRNLRYTATTIQLFHDYLATIGVKQQNFKITIKNNLKADGKIKYGLGSSGASIVLIVRLLNKFYKTNFDNLTILKFSILVQKHLNKYSSGGDLAASVYNAPVLYTRYDLNWLEQERFSFALLKNEWPLLNVKIIKNVPKFAVGWTKETFKPVIDGDINSDFFSNAEKLVHEFVTSFNPEIITKYQALLNELEKERPGLMTEKLKTLIATSHALGLSAKISGAGFGDSGIALIKTRKDKRKLREVWAKNDIMLLDIWRT